MKLKLPEKCVFAFLGGFLGVVSGLGRRFFIEDTFGGCASMNGNLNGQHRIQTQDKRIFIGVAAPIPFIVLVNIGKTIRGVKDHSPCGFSKACTGRKRRAFHLHNRTAFAFTVLHFFPCFAKETVR